MARKKNNTRKKVTRLHAITHTVKAANQVVIFVAFIAIALLVCILALPQRRKMQKLQNDYATSLEKRAAAQTQVDALQTQLTALKEDPKFLEIQARDRLPISHEGEKVFQFRR